jgi:hypothetical protein
VLVIDHPRRHFDDLDPAMSAMVSALASASAECDVPGAGACVNPESMPELMGRPVRGAGLVPLQGLRDAFEVVAGAGYHLCRTAVQWSASVHSP